jgi:hypothetical protein
MCSVVMFFRSYRRAHIASAASPSADRRAWYARWIPARKEHVTFTDLTADTMPTAALPVRRNLELGSDGGAPERLTSPECVDADVGLGVGVDVSHEGARTASIPELATVGYATLYEPAAKTSAGEGALASAVDVRDVELHQKYQDEASPEASSPASTVTAVQQKSGQPPGELRAPAADADVPAPSGSPPQEPTGEGPVNVVDDRAGRHPSGHLDRV